MHTLRPGRTIEEPHFDKRIRVGIGQVHLATFLEVVGGDPVRVGVQGVNMRKSKVMAPAL